LPTAGGEQARSVRGAVHSSAIAERDLSVQLSGWMLMEAAHSAGKITYRIKLEVSFKMRPAQPR
ncbi:hypothetical protein BS299_15720, partial [Mycobacterium tuberculosis M13]